MVLNAPIRAGNPLELILHGPFLDDIPDRAINP
ncbi:MAG: hypothetical protein ACJAXK_002988 [Yoonia sp.]